MTDIFFNFFTTGAGWMFAVFIFTVISSLAYLVNQYFKMPGRLLVFWSRCFTVLIMTPFMFFVEWPSSKVFYLAVSITAFLAGFADMRLQNVIAKHGGGVVSRSMPLIIFITFPVWFLFDVSLFYEYLDNPLRALGILGVLMGFVYFARNLKKCEISSSATKAMMPSVIAYSASTILNKFSMQQGNYEGVVFCYMYVQSLLVIPIIGIYSSAIKELKVDFVEGLSKRRIAGVSLIVSLFWLCGMVFRNTSMISIPNPAYFAAISQLSPVLISIFYLVVKHKEEGDVASGFGIVVCAIVLSLLVI